MVVDAWFLIDVLPHLKNISSLVENGTIDRGLWHSGRNDVEDARSGHNSHLIAGPAVQMSKLVVR